MKPRRTSFATGLLASSFVVFAAGSLVVVAEKTAEADNRFWANDIPTLFAIGKNTNGNEVQYGIHLDKDCIPVGDAPLYGYWRELDQGPNVIADLSMLDKTVYGIKGQWVTKRSPDESKVLMTLKASPDRGIAVITRRRDGKCVSEVITTINSTPARLDRIFVHVPGFLQVDWIEIRGVANGKPIIERVKH